MHFKKIINSVNKGFSFIENERFILASFQKYQAFGVILSVFSSARNIYSYLNEKYYKNKEKISFEGEDICSIIIQSLQHSKKYIGEININPVSTFRSKEEYIHEELEVITSFPSSIKKAEIYSASANLSKNEIKEILKKIIGEYLLSQYGKMISMKKNVGFSSIENKYIPCEIDEVVFKEINYCLNNGIGRSFLFHGRPGTGKSNYIKNIIFHPQFCKGAFNLFNINGISYQNILDIAGLTDFPFVVLDDLDHHVFNNAEIFHLIDKLKEMGKIILSSANILEELPQPLLRTGRFDRLIEINKLNVDAIQNLTGGEKDLMQELQNKTASEIEEFMFRVKIHGKEKAFEEKDEIFDKEKLSKKQLKIISDEDYDNALIAKIPISGKAEMEME